MTSRDEKGKNIVSKITLGTSGSSSSWSRFPVSSSKLAVNTVVFRSGRIALIWKDREYSFRFQGFFSKITKNVIPVSHVL